MAAPWRHPLSGDKFAASGAFSVGGGWYAHRNEDGSVTLLSGVHQEEWTVPAKTWITLVASVSKGGFSHAAAEQALALHQGG